MGAIAFDFDPTMHGFRLAVEGRERCRLPLLDSQLFRVWLRSYARIEPSLREGLARSQTLREWLAATDVASDQLVAALLAYDQAGVIGDRGWIEGNLTTEQVFLMLHRIARAHA